MALSAVYSLRVSGTILQFLGLLVTAWRIYFRLRIGRFWWEDAWATMLFLTGLLWIISQWMYALTSGLTSLIGAWIFSMSYTCIVTLARMSILFSIIRIVHVSPRLLQFAIACAAYFAASWIILLVEKVYQCVSNPSWHHISVPSGNPYCAVRKQISIFELTTDCIAVSILVALPLRMLWRVKLPRRQRRMILSIFASSILLATGAICHTVGQVLNVFVVMVAGINIEVGFAIFVCNLLVLVTYTYRFLLHETDHSKTAEPEPPNYFDDDFTTRITRFPAGLTSVDLDLSLSCQGIIGVSRNV